MRLQYEIYIASKHFKTIDTTQECKILCVVIFNILMYILLFLMCMTSIFNAAFLFLIPTEYRYIRHSLYSYAYSNNRQGRPLTRKDNRSCILR